MINYIKSTLTHRLRLVIFLFILVLGMSACSDSDDSEDNGGIRVVDFSILHEGAFGSSSAQEKEFVTLLTQDDYEAKLRQFSVDPPMNIDFSTQRVLFVSMGQQTSGGYSINVTRIEEFSDGLIATARLTSPGSNCAVLTVITSPYVFVQVTSRDDDIQVREQYEVFDCP